MSQSERDLASERSTDSSSAASINCTPSTAIRTRQLLSGPVGHVTFSTSGCQALRAEDVALWRSAHPDLVVERTSAFPDDGSEPHAPARSAISGP